MREEESKKKRAEEYGAYVKEITPVFHTGKNMLRAFWTGGAICLLGQLMQNLFQRGGIGQKEAATWSMLILVGLSVLLTGWNIFSKMARYAGAGVLVPITGFANSVASPAIEYKKEGQIFGIGCKIFTISGPVILYGVVVSWALGMIYYIGMCLRWW